MRATGRIGGTRRGLAVIVAAVLGLLLLWGIPAPAETKRTFDRRSLAGSWGWRAEETLPGGAFRAVAVGTATFDGVGSCALAFTESFGTGAFSDRTTSCTYDVQPDGTGSMDFAISTGERFEGAFVLVDRAREMYWIISSPVIVLEGVMRSR